MNNKMWKIMNYLFVLLIYNFCCIFNKISNVIFDILLDKFFSLENRSRFSSQSFNRRFLPLNNKKALKKGAPTSRFLLRFILFLFVGATFQRITSFLVKCRKMSPRVYLSIIFPFRTWKAVSPISNQM